MPVLENLKPDRVFHYFEQISAIPRGSGNMKKISQYCVNFAKEHGFDYHTDNSDNVVIFKNGTKGFENSEPIILQGHLDIVCQKTLDCDIDFENDGLSLYVEGDYIKANGTTLGADNGIAVAMVLSILESDTIAHPPIEAVFTTDEETGMYGAKALDMSILKGTRMINLDSEEDDCITVSCAGGSDFVATINTNKYCCNGTKLVLELKGLKGGHSGVEINKGRINANILMGRVLYHLKDKVSFEIIEINGGDKPNAIPNYCNAQLCTNDCDNLANIANTYIKTLKDEITDGENDFYLVATTEESGNFDVLGENAKSKLIHILNTAPNGVLKMSENIDGLVETSLNLGILKTEAEKITVHYSLRSNTKNGLVALEKELVDIFTSANFDIDTFGHYPPWEYKAESTLRDLYINTYKEHFDSSPRVEALHAGLECGIFASAINDIDCIAVGPTIFDVHTVNEKLSISSTHNLFKLIVDIIGKLQ